MVMKKHTSLKTLVKMTVAMEKSSTLTSRMVVEAVGEEESVTLTMRPGNHRHRLDLLSHT